MDVLTLLAEARDAGLLIEADGDRLRIRGAPAAAHIASQLGERKAEVLAAIKVANLGADTSTDDRSLESRRESDLLSAREPDFDPSHPLADFDWDSSPGYSPGLPIIRNGIEHKRETCNCRRGWRHVWGGTYCCDCWPCTDPKALVPDGGEPT